MSHLKALRHEGWRKAIHLSMLVLPVWIVVAPEAWRLRGLLIAFFFLLGVDLLRLRWKPLGRWLQPRLDGSLRPGEKHGLTSAHYWTLVACFLAWCGPERLAAAALAMPIVGDAAAAVVGRRCGRKRYGSKSLEGSAACFAGCMLAGAFFLPSEPLALAAAAGAATVVEALPLPVDDNLSVPLVAALVLRWCV